MQARGEKIIVNIINTQIKKLKENEFVYKSVHGETAYNKMLASLISQIQMTGTMNMRGTTPSIPFSVLAITHSEQISLLDDNDEDK